MVRSASRDFFVLLFCSVHVIFIYLFIYLFLSLFLSFFLYVFVSFFLSFFMSLFLSFFLYVFVSFCLSVFLSFFLPFFADLSDYVGLLAIQFGRPTVAMLHLDPNPRTRSCLKHTLTRSKYAFKGQI